MHYSTLSHINQGKSMKNENKNNDLLRNPDLFYTLKILPPINSRRSELFGTSVPGTGTK